MSTSPTASAASSVSADRPADGAAPHDRPPMPTSATSSRSQQVEDGAHAGVGDERLAGRGVVEEARAPSGRSAWAPSASAMRRNGSRSGPGDQ